MQPGGKPLFWRYVVRASNLLADGGGEVAPREQSRDHTQPVSTVSVFPTVQGPTDNYLSSQCDSRAADRLHQYSLSVAARIDLDGQGGANDSSEAAKDDFSAIVVITWCGDPLTEANRSSATQMTPWEGTVVTSDRSRQYAVTLYPASLQRFTGIFPGVVIGVHGVVLRRDPSTMRASEVALSRIVHAGLPKRAPVPSEPEHGSIRVFFASGPFGVTETIIERTLATIVEIAKSRGGQLCVICGPFLVVPPPGGDKDRHPDVWLDKLPPLLRLQQVLHNVAVGVGGTPLHVAFLPSADDLSCIPIVPTAAPLLFPESAFSNIHFACSNPTEFVVGGVHIGVTSYDSLTLLHGTQLSRGFLPTDMKVQQLCVSLLRSGLYVPHVIGHRAVDVTLLSQVSFGAGSGSMPHFVFVPNRTFTTPIAVGVGGHHGTVFGSCSNQTDQEASPGLTLMELYVADAAAAVAEGFTAANGVCVSTVQLVSSDD